MEAVTVDRKVVCGYRWYGPRVDVSDAYAHHVCDEEPDHDSQHRCICGASHSVKRTP